MMIGLPSFQNQTEDDRRLPHISDSCGVKVAPSDFGCASCGRSDCSQHTDANSTSFATITTSTLPCQPATKSSASSISSRPSLRSEPSFFLSSPSSTNTSMCESPLQLPALEQQGQKPSIHRHSKPHPVLPSLPPRLTTVATALASPPLSSEKCRKVKYVDALVDTTALVITSIWNTQPGSKKTKLVTLRVFIQEVLRRSRTTYSTLQTALFYLFRVKNLIIARQKDAASKDESDTATFCVPTSNSSTVQCNEDDLINCGRRMFLASLMIASKYLQDKNYRNKAWAKIAGLSVVEINATEIAFLKLIDYGLFISKATFERWYSLLHGHVNALCCVEGGSFREEANISLAGDMLFQVSTDNVAPYDSPLPSPTSPNAPRLPLSSPTNSSSSRSMLTPDSGVLSVCDWVSPVEGGVGGMVDPTRAGAITRFPVAQRASQDYQSPSPSPPLVNSQARKASSLRHAPASSLRRQALLQNVVALVSICPPSSTPGQQPIRRLPSPTENANGKRRLDDVVDAGPEVTKRARVEDDGYISD